MAVESRAPASLEEPLAPNAIRAEQRILGLAMLDTSGLTVMAECLSEADFFRPAHRLVARVITELAVDGELVDPVSVADALTRKGAVAPMREATEGGGWLAFTTLLLKAAADDLWTVNAEYEAKLIRRASFQRALIDVFSKGAAKAYGDGAPEDALDYATRQLAEIRQRFGGGPRSEIKSRSHDKPIYEAFSR